MCNPLATTGCGLLDLRAGSVRVNRAFRPLGGADPRGMTSVLGTDRAIDARCNRGWSWDYAEGQGRRVFGQPEVSGRSDSCVTGLDPERRPRFAQPARELVGRHGSSQVVALDLVAARVGQEGTGQRVLGTLGHHP